MRCFCLVTTLVLVGSLAGCSHQHICDPTCCPKCCEAQATTAQSEVRDGLSAAQWAAKAEGADHWTRQEVILKLASFGPSSLCYATDWMGSEDAGARYAGAELARMIGSPAGPAVPALRTLLRDKDPTVRTGALRALATFAKDDLAPVIHDLGRALDDGEWQVRYQAARTLASAGHHAGSELPHLEHRSHHDPDERVRRANASAFEVVQTAWILYEKARRNRSHK